MHAEGHYVGPHSDQHLLYCEWDKARTLRISRGEFANDLLENVAKLGRHGINEQERCFVPPYEHYNAEISLWSTDLGWTLVNYTPGTRSNADYTGEADRNFVSSQIIFESILNREREDPHGLNGFILLLHVGSGPGRSDKFYLRFGELLDHLQGRGYELVRIDELLAKPQNAVNE
jgi:peptidoglycan/xylan/chitin deacetylase (PgdA/CDA1 family)